MSAFCGGSGSVPALTELEMAERFPGGILPDGMPEMPNGLADEQWVVSYVKKLHDELEKIPRLPKLSETQPVPFNAPETKAPLADFVKKENTLHDNLKQEYCFYERRYFAALDKFLQSLADNSLRGQPEALVTANLNRALELNQKVTLLTQITNGIAQLRYSQATIYNTEINSINKNLQERQKKLMEQREVLTKETAAADLHKRMVDYTTEKNKANQNLLTLYGILNVTAIAMIFYISRS
jgi:hypothetical protein